MSRIYPPSRQGKIALFRERRDRARQAKDWVLVRNCDIELATLGDFETTQGPEMEQAVPPRPRRGRKPLPRCEHDMILKRCPTCSPEEQV